MDLESASVKEESDVQYAESEYLLPGVLISLESDYHSFLCDMHELGRQNHDKLRDSSRQLLFSMACHLKTVKTINAIFNDEDSHLDDFHNMFFVGTATEVSISLV